MKITTVLIPSLWCLMACSHQKQIEQQKVSQDTEIMETKQSEPLDVSAIELVDLQENPVSWEDLRGKTVFLNFWATWCKPCIMEMPSIDQAYHALKGEDVVFLAASYEEPEKIKDFQEKKDFSFPFVHVKNSLESLNIYSIPTTFIINKEGKLVETIVGSQQWDTPEMLNELKQK